MTFTIFTRLPSVPIVFYDAFLKIHIVDVQMS